ncbi:dephospho-CoA kinase [Niallia endozanthoxylica]|uniref:Dephospho-CoA kinase n=1 Tax=Niallia endozanthoxylica TaxID=2036016 RepID=A0A5J5I5B4_9BACI|nr:dephospho-CoA kinase [Niallia endozanthoxylica]KAA9031719.1 dephospho-CoA kinase [Niallia endozanthoxylica]
MAMIIGLTGGIASGKSTVSEIIKNLDITVIDADIEARLAVGKGEEAYQKIINHFGQSILLNDGTINRAKLGEIIFNNEQERNVLNGIVHPAVRSRMAAKQEEAINKGESLIVKDIPLLFESKLTNTVDRILLVYVDEEIQLQRLMNRNQYTREEALARIQSQMPLKEKKELADAVIDNNGSIEQTERQLFNILKEWGLKKEV